MTFEKWPANSTQESQEGFVGKIRKKVQEKVNESRLPNTNYESTVGVYGGKLVLDEEGKMIYDTTGFISKIDRFGDPVLRTYDEHLVKEPWKLLKSHPKWFFKFLAPGPKRYRGTPDEIMENVERLGLTDYYGPHKKGIEIKKPEIYTKGITLQDIYRADLIGSSQLNEIDRLEALAAASQYIKKIHNERGGIGELVVGDVIFKEKEGDQVINPVLNLPDIVYNKEKNVGEKEKKATDLLDFLASIGVEEYRQSQKWEEVKKALKIILDNYSDQEIISLTGSFARRGRLTLQGDAEVLNLPDTLTKKARVLFSQHNKARFGSKKDFEGQLRQALIDVCEEKQLTIFDEELLEGNAEYKIDEKNGKMITERARKEALEKLRREIVGKSETNQSNEDKLDIVRSLRLPKKFQSWPVRISQEEQQLISEIESETKGHLERNYHPGFGVFPSENPEDNFYNQVYARDFAHAAGNYFAETNPGALKDSLQTLLKHQRPDGMVPLRVEREYQQIKLIPGLRSISRPLFRFWEEKIKGKKEHPVFEGGDFGASGSEDTVPALLIAAGEFFIASKEGRHFVEDHFGQLEKAVDFFKTKTDKRDGLAVITRNNPDWADSLKRKGKLGGINVWWARSLRMMEFMSKQLGREDDARKYKEEFKQVKHSIIEKLYNSTEGYFRTKEGEDRVDTVASIFGALYLLSPKEAVKVEETLKRRVQCSSGLQNFDPPYTPKEIFWGHRTMGRLAALKGIVTGHKERGMDDYHNRFVWPWVTCENIQVKIKIALQHEDESVRNQYKKEAIDDLIQMSNLFKKLGGAYEVVDPDKPEPASISFYTPPKNLMGSLAAYQGAYKQLKELGWV